MSTHVPALELQTGDAPHGTVIWLHGLGADGWDFLPVVHELGLPEDLALRFVFPHAPRQPVAINNGMVMRAWYDIALDGLERRTDERGIRSSAALVDALIAREATRGIPPKRVVLAGFSQGGVIVQHCGLRQRESLAGILALSTYLALPGTLATEASPANSATPILMAHGTQDNVIPIAMAERSRQTLQEHGYPVEWHSYPMAHSVAHEELRAISAFIQRCLG
ncbi:MAG: alpha/beta hydrolase [Pseudomonadota bacterium]|nr:alpha/beta hydrolase [Pseudomonadota bacterium]